MQCPKCLGMIGGGREWKEDELLDQWHCIFCGLRLDNLMIKNRLNPPIPRELKASRSRDTVGVLEEDEVGY